MALRNIMRRSPRILPVDGTTGNAPGVAAPNPAKFGRASFSENLDEEDAYNGNLNGFKPPSTPKVIGRARSRLPAGSQSASPKGSAPPSAPHGITPPKGATLRPALTPTHSGHSLDSVEKQVAQGARRPPGGSGGKGEFALAYHHSPVPARLRPASAALEDFTGGLAAVRQAEDAARRAAAAKLRGALERHASSGSAVAAAAATAAAGAAGAAGGGPGGGGRGAEGGLAAGATAGLVAAAVEAGERRGSRLEAERAAARGGGGGGGAAAGGGGGGVAAARAAEERAEARKTAALREALAALGDEREDLQKMLEAIEEMAAKRRAAELQIELQGAARAELARLQVAEDAKRAAAAESAARGAEAARAAEAGAAREQERRRAAEAARAADAAGAAAALAEAEACRRQREEAEGRAAAAHRQARLAAEEAERTAQLRLAALREVAAEAEAARAALEGAAAAGAARAGAEARLGRERAALQQAQSEVDRFEAEVAAQRERRAAALKALQQEKAHVAAVEEQLAKLAARRAAGGATAEELLQQRLAQEALDREKTAAKAQVQAYQQAWRNQWNQIAQETIGSPGNGEVGGGAAGDNGQQQGEDEGMHPKLTPKLTFSQGSRSVEEGGASPSSAARPPVGGALSRASSTGRVLGSSHSLFNLLLMANGEEAEGGAAPSDLAGVAEGEEEDDWPAGDGTLRRPAAAAAAEEEEEDPLEGVCAECRAPTEGLPVAHYAAAMGHMGCLIALGRRDPGRFAAFDRQRRSPLFYAAANGHAACCGFLVDRAPQCAALGDLNGDAPLHAAASAGAADAVQVLLEKGRVDAAPRNRARMVPAHLAKTPEALEALAAAGADLNAGDGQRRTPLFVACAMGRAPCAELLCELLDAAGLELQVPDKRGDTPLHAAACNGAEACLHLLLQHGINPAVPNKKGLRPVDLAARRKHPGCERILVEYHLHHTAGTDFDSVLFFATLEGHRNLKATLLGGGGGGEEEAYEIIKRAPRDDDGGGRSGLAKQKSLWSIKNGRSVRLQQFGVWIAFEDQNTGQVYWYNSATQRHQFDVPPEVEEKMNATNSPQKLGHLRQKASMRLKQVGDWIQYRGAHDKTFYYHETSGDFQWERPAALGPGDPVEAKADDPPGEDNTSHATAGGGAGGEQHPQPQPQPQPSPAAAAAAAGGRSARSRAESQWEEVAAQDGQWVAYTDPGTGHVFWHNAATGESQWDRPAEEVQEVGDDLDALGV